MKKNIGSRQVFNTFGFTLPGALLSILILSVVGVTATEFISIAMSSVNNAKKEMSFVNVRALSKLIISNDDGQCGIPDEIFSRLKLDPSSDLSFKKIEFSEIGRSEVKLKTGIIFDGVQIQSITLENLKPDNKPNKISGDINLIGDKGVMHLGSKTLKETTTVILTLDASNNISSCTDLATELKFASAKKAACEALGLEYDEDLDGCPQCLGEECVEIDESLIVDLSPTDKLPEGAIPLSCEYMRNGRARKIGCNTSEDSKRNRSWYCQVSTSGTVSRWFTGTKQKDKFDRTGNLISEGEFKSRYSCEVVKAALPDPTISSLAFQETMTNGNESEIEKEEVNRKLQGISKCYTNKAKTKILECDQNDVAVFPYLAPKVGSCFYHIDSKKQKNTGWVFVRSLKKDGFTISKKNYCQGGVEYYFDQGSATSS